jgi:hypothetical protein
VFGPDQHELALSQLRLLARAPDLGAPQPTDFGPARPELVEDFERNVEGRRGHGVQDDLRHGVVEARAADALAQGLGARNPRSP